MMEADIHEAKAQLPKLVEPALDGEDVVIVNSGTPMVRLVPVHQPKGPRIGGQWKGQVQIADDFDDLPEDIKMALGITGP